MALPRIFLAGHNGMVGSAIAEQLNAEDCKLVTRTRSDLDLTNSAAVQAFFQTEKIDQIYLAAAKVGGIHANHTYPADFIADNLAIELNVIQSAYKAGVEKLLFLGSSCIYPKLAKQPMSEEALLSGALEPTNEPYAIAKIAGIKLCESFNRQYGTDYRSVMPTNLYGPRDNFHPDNSHVIPALIRRIHSAKINNDPDVTIWGSGTPKREFLHVDDMAAACIHTMNLDLSILSEHTHPNRSHINVGTGKDVSIDSLAKTIANIIGYEGKLIYDTSKPDGAPRKLLDVSRLKKMGWKSEISLHQGLKTTYKWYKDNLDSLRQ